MNFWKKFTRDDGHDYRHDEVEQAEMLEAYTRWVKGEKLSHKQKRLLKMCQQNSEMEDLKPLIEFAHYRFRETDSVIPRPGAKQRIANELMERIGRRSAETTPAPDIDGELAVAHASPEQVGADSELIQPHLPPSQLPESEQLDESPPPLQLDNSSGLKLSVIEGGDEGSEYPISALQLIIGRGLDATIQLDANEAVSQQHALLTVEMDALYITDLGSNEGTFVDGDRISERTPLREGSTITIGRQSLEITDIHRDTGIFRLLFEEVEGADVGNVYDVSLKEMTVGRGRAARLRLPDPTGRLSRLHARFDLKNKVIYIADMASTNGTYVDDVCINAPTAIKAGSIVQFGGITCEVVDIEP
jgi:pSer/pThr/pTyr-binding forkhead associated (FHA) protein